MTAAVSVALCYCGRPFGHTGRHIGSPQRLDGQAPQAKATPKAKAAPGSKSKLRAMVEREIQDCHASIVRLKGEIRDRQNELLDAETKLKPLVALLDVYRDLALPGPERKAPALPVATPRDDMPRRPEAPKPAASLANESDNEADFEPVEVEFNQLQKWAAARNMPCKTWDDLPAINRRREEFELPCFKRKLNGRVP